MKNEIQITEEQENLVHDIADVRGDETGLSVDNPIELILAIVDPLSPEQRKQIAKVKQDPGPAIDKRQLSIELQGES